MSSSKSTLQNELLAQAQTRLIEELQSSQRHYAHLVDHLKDVVFHLDENLSWSFLNQAWTELAGQSVEQSRGQSALNYFRSSDAEPFEQALLQLLSGELADLEAQYYLLRCDGDGRHVEVSCRAMRDDTGRLSSVVGVIRDVSERLESEQKIYHMAYHDSLTNLANRRQLMERLSSVCVPSSSRSIALLYLDLDDFKDVNDMYGHSVGDAVLQEIAQQIPIVGSSENYLAARIGGDEFIILFEQLASHYPTARAHLSEAARGLLERISRINKHVGTFNEIKCSIGITLVNSQSISAEECLKQADFAMYHAKRAGKNRIQFYDAELAKQESRRQQLQRELCEAERYGQFTVFYQPQVEADKNKVQKAEVLLRWQHPQRGLLIPKDFIHELENSDLIKPLGQWVLDQSLAQLSAWRKMGYESLSLSVNASAGQFQNPEFADDVRRSLQRFDIPGECLEIEITETTALNNVHSAIAKMRALKDIGVKIALDDFGTGYSSLSYLKHLPIDTIKLDRSFVQGLPDNGYDSAIVQSTLLMSKHLKLSSVAEGVESEEQCQFLKALGCELYQGYLFSPAISADQFAEYLLQRS
ncbi:GGDEF and EAL domain-containing protein [uncultured Pseudoteredinibacter sp.]|uniref:putative bifunctional diguanylate cyclase/phosphodiesterase n=1 Tax=uncultured Pseudoteredinibacter sp. TaxID=1641701 RepID=UPI0026210C59|nr:GGDEF and EAL domain-containing protein [uncultured Pseudoteredinibacter sp.]